MQRSSNADELKELIDRGSGLNHALQRTNGMTRMQPNTPPAPMRKVVRSDNARRFVNKEISKFNRSLK